MKVTHRKPVTQTARPAVRRLGIRLAAHGFSVLGAALRNADADRILRLAAALAFYTALGLAPLLVVLLWCLSLLGPGAETALVDQVRALIGADGAAFVETVVESSRGNHERGWAGVISIAALLFSATGVFGQLQESLNIIWRAPTPKRSRVVGWLRKRLLSLAMVGAISFLMIVSLAASTIVTLLEQWLGGPSAWRLVTEGASFLMFVALFAIMFRFFPDVRVPWRDVFGGAAVTALMFVLGKFAIGQYLARGSLTNAYGAAGSMLIVLVWVYYSSIIVFFGAELAQAWASHRTGRRRPPVVTSDQDADVT